MAKRKGFEALMGWLAGRGWDPDQAESLLRSLPNVENMTPADLQRVIDQMNAPSPRARMENPISVEERVAGNPKTGMRPDPNIRASLQELDPEFAARMDTASADEIMEAYRNAVNQADNARRGRPKMVMDTPVGDVAPPAQPARQMELPLGPSAQEPDIRALIPSRLAPGMTGDRAAAHRALKNAWPLPYDAAPEDLAGAMGDLSPVQRQYMQALEKNDWLGFDYPSQAASSGLLGDAPQRWEMSPELLAARQSLIDSYQRGPGVPGALSGPGKILTSKLDMIPAPLRGLPGSGPRRIGTTAGVPVGPSQADVIDVPCTRVPPQRGLSVVRQADEVADGPRVPWKTLAAGIGAGVGVSQLVPEEGYKTTPKAAAESTTADLVAETRPAPKVEATPEVPKPQVKQGPPDYSAQARQLIARANDIQREAGRQTPESIALIKEADNLYRLAAEGRSKGTQPAIMPVEQQNRQTSSIQRNAQQQIAQNQGSDYRSQARRMMAELNSRSSQGNISQGEYSAMKRRIDQLFALADQEDNARRRAS
jgi:hypothetical protein